MDNQDLVKKAVDQNLGTLSDQGVLLVNTGEHTGRCANLRYIARHPDVEKTIDWRPENKSLPYDSTIAIFDALEAKLAGEKHYVFQGYAGAFPVTVTSTSPWHIAFARNMFRDTPIESLQSRLASNPKKIKVYHAPYAKVSELGTSAPSETIIILDPKEMRVAVIGTAYAGEIKKSVFSLCNYALPEYGILPMHASANCLKDGSESCVLFGLSGTGKTTLSASADRSLIGDDEIVWTTSGLSNLEGGCYAKLIGLTEEREPEIYRAVNRKGAILENVAFHNETHVVDFEDDTLTENTRGSYPIQSLEHIYDQQKEASAPNSIVFLVADAFGAMPAVAKLDAFQAQYHFLSGYTAKVAGTEIGVKTPKPVFSACFGSPFMPRHPSVYAELLAECAQTHGTSIWLLNTGWTKGGYGNADRYPLTVTRTILSAIQSGELDKLPRVKHPVFGFEVPTECPGIDPKWLAIPEGESVMGLAKKFGENIVSMGSETPDAVIDRGGPNLEV